MNQARIPDNVSSTTTTPPPIDLHKLSLGGGGGATESVSSTEERAEQLLNPHLQGERRARWKTEIVRLLTKGVREDQLPTYMAAFAKQEKYGIAGAATGYGFREAEALEAAAGLGVNRPERLLRHHSPDEVLGAVARAQAMGSALRNPAGWIVWYLH